MNAANPMILSEAGTGYNPIAILISMPLFTFHPCALGQVINQAADESGVKISAGLLTKFSSPQLAKEAGRRIIMAVYQDSTELRAE